jgi:glycerol-3-phosphate acyltransferase PlsY
LVNDALLHGPFYGNFYVRLVGALGFAFLMGSIPIGPLTRWLFAGVDWRLGSTARGLVPVFLFFAAFIPVEIAVHGGGTMIGLGAGVAVVLGHCYCPWLRFRGGTGAAVQLGALAALSWPCAVFFAVLWLAAAVSSNYSAVGTLTATLFNFVPLWFFLGPAGAFYGVATLLVVASRNRGHFVRLSEGTERPMRRPEPVREESFIRLEGQPVQSF